MRTAARRDKTEQSIVEILRAMGCSVHLLSAKGVPDLLVGVDGLNILVETKSRKGRLTEYQIIWHEEWRGQVHIARTPENAQEIVEGIRRSIKPEKQHLPPLEFATGHSRGGMRMKLAREKARIRK